jgi:hypothetical protein
VDCPVTIKLHLFEWITYLLFDISFFGFGHDTEFGRDLEEWAIRNISLHESAKEVDADIIMEMKFPFNYPNSAPLFRIIRPRFTNLEVDLKMSAKISSKSPSSKKRKSNEPQTSSMETDNNKANISEEEISDDEDDDIVSSSSSSTHDNPPSAVPPSPNSNNPQPTPTSTDRKLLTVSRALEAAKAKWNSSTHLLDFLPQIRNFLVESGAKIDMESTLEGYNLSTVGNFWRWENFFFFHSNFFFFFFFLSDLLLAFPLPRREKFH